MRKHVNQLFSDLRPTYLGTILDVQFYEHPDYGDEAPILAKQHGVWYNTDWWEIPTTEEVVEVLHGY